MSAQFSVMPFRYSNDVAAMVAFLEELGLRRRIDSEGFAELHAGAGRVMVHAAGGKFAGGQTYLNLMAKTVEDAVDLASRKIGRASCRERGESWAVPASLERKRRSNNSVP